MKEKYLKMVFLIVIALLSLKTNAQGLSQLAKCTTHSCIDKWLVNWEKSFTNELKTAGKLQNKTNRNMTIITILQKYQMPIYDNFRGPVRVWVRKILTEKDVKDDDITNYLRLLDEAQDRCMQVEKNGR